MPRILLEVCVDSPAGFKAAVEGGADRIELCSSLSVGGLTPSPGFMAFAGKAARPSRAMIRPRVGSYVFSEDETDMMRRDIDAARAAGLAGVVIGANLVSGQLDEKTTARLAKHAAGLEMTLHRSVDLMPHPMEAVDVAIGLGFRTILTSGGQLKAPDGAEIVAAMVMQRRRPPGNTGRQRPQSRQCCFLYQEDRRERRTWLLQRALAGNRPESGALRLYRQ